MFFASLYPGMQSIGGYNEFMAKPSATQRSSSGCTHVVNKNWWNARHFTLVLLNLVRGAFRRYRGVNECRNIILYINHLYPRSIQWGGL